MMPKQLNQLRVCTSKQEAVNFLDAHKTLGIQGRTSQQVWPQPSLTQSTWPSFFKDRESSITDDKIDSKISNHLSKIISLWNFSLSTDPNSAMYINSPNPHLYKYYICNQPLCQDASKGYWVLELISTELNTFKPNSVSLNWLKKSGCILWIHINTQHNSTAI